MDQSFLDRLEDIVNANLSNEQFGVEELAKEVSMSRFQMHRKLRNASGQSASQFIREVRLKRSMQLLKEGESTASEIAYRVGFGSPTYFSKCFSEYYGFTPGEAKNIIIPDVKHTDRQNIPAPNLKKTELVKAISFWDELKRRNIISVALVYILTGWLTLQLLNLAGKFTAISPSVSFLFFILILISFPVALYFAWDYKKLEKPFTGTFVITSLTVLIFSTHLAPELIDNFPEKAKYQYLPIVKSIAVLEFRNLSEEPDNQYFTFGVMETIISHLSGVKDLEVSPRTSTEQYRDSYKSITQIAGELDVEYILEGSVQKFENQVRVTANVFEVKGNRNILSRQYTEQSANFFSLMTDIANDITNELNIKLSTQEEELLNSIPTNSVRAYDLYLMGKMFHANYRSKFDNEDLSASENLYKQAVSLDSNFALAYVGLGEICRERMELFDVHSMYDQEYADSILLYAAKAIKIDPNLANAYALRGHYFESNNQIDKAIADQQKAISLKPGLTQSYINLGKIYRDSKGDPVQAFYYLKKAQSTEKNGTLIPDILFELAWVYLEVEDYENTEKLIRLSNKFRPDLKANYGPLMWMNCVRGKFETAYVYADSICRSGPNNPECLYWYGMLNSFMGNYEKALNYFERSTHFTQEDKEVGSVIKTRETKGNIHQGYIYRKRGDYNRAMEILNDLLEGAQGLEDSKVWEQAEIYAAMGEHEKSIAKLKELESINQYLNKFSFIPHYYIFDDMLDNPELISMLDSIAIKKAEARNQINNL